MVVRNLRSIKPKVWIPPEFTAVYKITVEDRDGNVLDITDKIIDCTVKDFVTESIGEFEYALWNVNEEYTNLWKGGEIFRYYKDYSTTATTLRFRGKLERPSNRGNKLVVRGRSDSLLFNDIHITESYDNIDTSVILKDIVSKYAPGFTYNNVPALTGTTLTVNWTEKVFWEAVQELAAASNYDVYVDANLDFNFFEKESRDNNQEGIVHDLNLLDVSDFAPNTSLVKNKIIVYGSLVDGAQVLYTAISNDADYGVNSPIGLKEDIINDDNIVTYQGAVDRGEFELSQGINPPIVGDVTCVNLLATIKPGDNIRISAPIDNLPFSYYNTSGYEDKIQQDIITTTVFINKEPRDISHAMKTIIQNANDKDQTSTNPFRMNFSYNFTYESDTGTHTNTEIVDGVLKLQDGQSSGTWISPLRTLSSNLNEAYLRLLGETLTGATVSVTGNGGINYQVISNKEKITISAAKGTSLGIKIELNDTKTQITASNLLYTED